VAEETRNSWDSPIVKRRLTAVLATVLIAWTWYVHFWPSFETTNESIRLYFVQAVTESGRPELDAVCKRHGHVPVDRSEYLGHVYMDKAPGLSLLALPLYPLAQAIHPAVVCDDLWMFGIVVCLLTVTLPCWLLLWLLVRYLSRQNVSPRVAAITALALALASPLFAYATLYFGHALAAACVGGAVCLLALPDEGAGSLRRRLAVGSLLGLAGLVDTPVFVMGAMVVLWAGARALPEPLGAAVWQRLRAILPIVLPLALAVAVQLAYNAWMLGDPLRFAYQFKGEKAFAALHSSGLFGFHLPQLDVLALLLFGPSRGLFYHSPWLVPALFGLIIAARDPELSETRRLDAIALACTALGYAIVVSGFADWKAGDAAYARHLVPILPLLTPGLAYALASPKLARPGRAFVLTTIAVGLILTMPTIATFPYHFTRLERPVLELGWPLWLLGNFSPSVGRALGWSDWTSAAVFFGFCLLPWLLTLRLPHAIGPGREPISQRLAVWSVALSSTLLWLVALVAAVPHPGRIVQVARAQASSMLGPDADERDGNKPWQKILQQAKQRNERARRENALKNRN
jgi:hypothetical protein